VYCSASIRHLIAYLLRTRPSSSIGGWPSSSNWHNGKLRPRCSAKAGHSRYRGVAEVLRHRSLPPLAIAIIARPCRGLSLPLYDCCIQYYPSRQTPLAPLALAAAPVSSACSALLSTRRPLFTTTTATRDTIVCSAPVTPRPRSLVRLHDHHRVHSIILNHCHGWSSGALVANTAFTTAPPNH
jgi:hypothetical protein